MSNIAVSFSFNVWNSNFVFSIQRKEKDLDLDYAL